MVKIVIGVLVIVVAIVVVALVGLSVVFPYWGWGNRDPTDDGKF